MSIPEPEVYKGPSKGCPICAHSDCRDWIAASLEATFAARATDISGNQATSTSVTATISNGTSGVRSGLQGYWKLEESGSSTVAHDATSGAHDGQLTNFTFTPSPWITPGAF